MKKLIFLLVAMACIIGVADANIIDDAYSFFFGGEQPQQDIGNINDQNITAVAIPPLVSNVAVDSEGITAEINYDNDTQIVTSDSNELITTAGDNLIIVRSRE